MKIKVKKLSSEAKLPSKANPGDAGWDLTAVSEKFDILHKYFEYDFGLSVEIPEGYVGLIFPRSSNSKKDLILSNAVGVIDAGYRGPLSARFKTLTNVGVKKYNVGDKIAQLVILELPSVEFEETDILSESVRGTGSYGSSGS